MRAVRALVAVGAGAVLVWACKDYITNPGGAQRQARQVRLDSAQFTIPDGDTLRLTATVLDQNDSVFAALPAGVTFGWSSSDTAVARVDTTGLVTGVGPGRAAITGTVTTALGKFGASAAGTVVQPLARLVAVSGGGQADTIGATLAESLAVQALDSQGRGVPGVAVQFAASHGALSAGVMVTDAAGFARVTWTLGTRAGTDTTRATAALLPDSVAAFGVRVRSGAPDSLLKVSGDAQTGAEGAALAAPLAVRVADRAGNPISADSITWTAATGGGSLLPAQGPTDSTGHAQAVWTLGPTVGAQSATAASAGIAAPVTFTATATLVVGPPATIAANAGNNQTATAGTAVAVPPSVIVKDALGNPVPGVAITFAVTGGGGSITGPNQTTGTNGIATVGSWILGSTPGTNTLIGTATAGGVTGNPVTFMATGTPGAGGQVLTWVGNDPGGPSWSTAANWSPALVPNSNDTLVIGATTHSPVLSARSTAALIRMSGDSLTLNGHTLAVGDSLTVGGSATVVMKLAADSLVVGGTITMGGGDETGRLTAGVLAVSGNFIQPPAFSASAFAASGTHKTVLMGTVPESVVVAYAGGSASHFQDLELRGTQPLKFSGRIPVQGNAAVLAARPVTGTDTLVVTGNVTTASGSALTLAGLDVAGALSVLGSYGVGVTNFTGSGQTIPVLPYGTLAVTQGAATTAGAVTVAGNLLVRNLGTLTLGGRLVAADTTAVSAGTLTLNGHALVDSALIVNGSGALVMSAASDSAVVHGGASFGGGDETGKLAAGVLLVDGDFNGPAAFSATAWLASGTHKTVLTGLQDQAVNLYYTGNAHFQNLEVRGTHTITLATRVPVAGNFDLSGNANVYGMDTLAVTGNVAQDSGGSELILPGLDVGGSLVSLGYYDVALTNFTGTNQVIPTDLRVFQNVTVSGPGAVPGGSQPQLAIAGDLLVTGAGSLTLDREMYVTGKTVVTAGSVTLAGHLLAMGDSMRVSGTGAVVMTNALDSLVVNGNLVWGGGDETGKLTNGVLVVQNGNFTQPPANSATSFNTSGSFRTLFVNPNPVVLTMTYAGGSASHFNHLDLTPAFGGVVMQTDIPVVGTLADTLSTVLPTAFTGNGHTLSAGAIVMNGATMDHVLLRITGPIVALDTVTFQNYAPGDTQLGITSTGSYSLTGLNFLTTPSGGYYVSADGAGLSLDIQSNLTPSQGASFTQQLNGATVTWH